MSQEYSLTGVVLSKMSLKETDILFTFLSLEQGKITLIARGAKKAKTKQGAFLQMGSILQVDTVASTSDIATLRSVKSVFIPENLSYIDLLLFEESLVLTKNVCKQNHILITAVQELMQFIPVFCHKSQKFLISFAYKIKLLSHLGFLGSLRQCSKCYAQFKENEHQFRPSFGLICSKCSSPLDETLSFEELKVFICLQEQKYEIIEKLSLSQKLKDSFASKQETFFREYS